MKHRIISFLTSPYIICLFSFALGVGFRYILKAPVVDDPEPESYMDWDGGVYYGDIQNGVPNGEGRLEREGMTYAGTWNEGVLSFAKIESSKYIYDGDVANYKFSGYGVCKYKDGHSYWGYWKDDFKSGLGKLKGSDGHITFTFYKEGYAQVPEDQSFNVGETVYGIDVSNHQGVMNWQDVYICCNKYGRTTGKMDNPVKYIQPVLFTYIKATEGATYNDPMYEFNMSEAQKCGIHAGAYHFLTMTSSAKDQAENFVNHVMLSEGNLPPVLDLEKNNSRRPVTDEEFAQIIPIAKEWLSIVENEYNTPPIIYTNMHVYEKFIKNDQMLSKYPLWLALPGNKQPEVTNCIMWQFTHHGKINGIGSEYVDINMFNGNYEALQNLLIKNREK